jgi:hypothetical protein
VSKALIFKSFTQYIVLEAAHTPSGCDDNQWHGNPFDTADPEDCID